MSSSSNPSSIFKKVTRADKRECLQRAVAQAVPLTAKGSGELVFTLIAEHLMEGDILVCRLAEAPGEEQKSESYLIKFHLAEYSYFAQIQGNWQDGRVYLDCRADLFQLQRRKTTRVSLPGDYNAYFNVMEHLGQNVFYEARLLDYSSGGAKIIVTSPRIPFRAGDLFVGTLRLGHRGPTKLRAEVRYVAPPRTGFDEQILGIMFVKVDMTTEAKLMAFTMDLHREFLALKEKEQRGRRTS